MAVDRTFASVRPEPIVVDHRLHADGGVQLHEAHVGVEADVPVRSVRRRVVGRRGVARPERGIDATGLSHDPHGGRGSRVVGVHAAPGPRVDLCGRGWNREHAWVVCVDSATNPRHTVRTSAPKPRNRWDMAGESRSESLRGGLGPGVGGILSVDHVRTPTSHFTAGLVTVSGNPDPSELTPEEPHGGGVASPWPTTTIAEPRSAGLPVPGHGVLAFGVVAVLLTSGAISALVAPGRFSPDSLDQYNQTLKDMYTDWHTPILTGLWGFLDTSPELVLLLFVSVVMVSAMLLLASETKVTWAVVAVAVACLWPMTFDVLVTVGKDAWFAGFFLAGAALSAHAVHFTGRKRVGVFVAIGALWWLAVAARANAIIPVFAVVAFGWPLTVGGEGRAGWWSRRGLKRIGLSAAVALGIVLSQSVYTSVVVQPIETHPEQPGYQFDLVALSLRTGQMLIPASSLRPGTDLATLRAHWNEHDGSGLWFTADAPVLFALPPAQVAELRHAWIDAIEEHPLQYLEHRAKYSLSLLGLTSRSYGVFSPSSVPSTWGFTYALPRQNAPWFRSWYERTFVEGGIFGWFRQWMFIAILLAVGVTSRGRRSIAVRCLMAGGLGSTCSFMLAGASSGFRYAWFTALCSLLAAAIGLFWMTHWIVLRRRPSAPTAEVAHLDSSTLEDRVEGTLRQIAVDAP